MSEPTPKCPTAGCQKFAGHVTPCTHEYATHPVEPNVKCPVETGENAPNKDGPMGPAMSESEWNKYAKTLEPFAGFTSDEGVATPNPSDEPTKRETREALHGIIADHENMAANCPGENTLWMIRESTVRKIIDALAAPPVEPQKTEPYVDFPLESIRNPDGTLEWVEEPTTPSPADGEALANDELAAILTGAARGLRKRDEMALHGLAGYLDQAAAALSTNPAVDVEALLTGWIEKGSKPGFSVWINHKKMYAYDIEVAVVPIAALRTKEPTDG